MKKVGKSADMSRWSGLFALFLCRVVRMGPLSKKSSLKVFSKIMKKSH